MKLLHLDASILGPNSASRALSAAAVARLAAADPGLTVTYRDLAADPLPHLSGAYLFAMMGGEGAQATEPLARDLAQGEAALEEFLAADIVVIGSPVYNFTVPSQLKAWIDRICIAGRTFRYSEKGPEGLAGDKRVILTVSRGGLYGPGSPAAAFEHGETYLRGVFAFLGVTDLEVIVAEGLRVSEEQRAAATAAALAQIDELRAGSAIRAAA
jgi:FMN-dependent NADH-azoreductase